MGQLLPSAPSAHVTTPDNDKRRGQLTLSLRCGGNLLAEDLLWLRYVYRNDTLNMEPVGALVCVTPVRCSHVYGPRLCDLMGKHVLQSHSNVGLRPMNGSKRPRTVSRALHNLGRGDRSATAQQAGFCCAGMVQRAGFDAQRSNGDGSTAKDRITKGQPLCHDSGIRCSR